VDWNGSVVAVTGASQGIGAAVARAVSARGARVGLIARDADALRDVAGDLPAKATVAPADVTDESGLTESLAAVSRELGPIDVIVTSAGVGAYGPFVDTPSETFRHLMEVNFFGTLHAVRAVLPSMLERRKGHLVAVASVAGRLAAPLESAYSASKFAVVGLLESLGTEVEPAGVGVTLVDPGPVATEFFTRRGEPYARTWPRAVPPETVAEAVVHAVERDRSEVFVPRWLGLAHAAKTLAPTLYRFGTRRDVARELARFGRSVS